jgi:hypothetical protein
LGDDATVLWATVRAAVPEVMLSGYQNFVFQDFTNIANWQSCAVELRAQGSPEGHVGFSFDGEDSFQDWFTFTNPHAEAVLVHFTLRYHPLDEEGLVIGEEVEVAETSIEIPARLRRNLNVGLIFNGSPGQPVSMSYRATALPQPPLEGEAPTEPESRDILAVHLQSNTESTALGGHLFTSDGQRALSWLQLGTEFDSLTELYNIGSSLIEVRAELVDGSGEVIWSELIPIESRDAYRGLDSRLLREQILTENEQLNASTAIRLELAIEGRGRFFAKTTAFRGADFAIVNPAATGVPVVNPEFKQ